MFELIRVGNKSFYINSPAKIGLYLKSESDVYLIDSGNDKDAGRRIRKILDENRWNLQAIINTHSNADHIGGNHYLQQQTNCRIFSNKTETAFTKYPILEPAFLYGAYPFLELRHKFLMATESNATELNSEGFPDELEIIPLPGHFFDMIGIRTPDGTAFLADCVSSRETIEKYHITFIYDVAAYLETLDKIEKLKAEIFVPAHAEATSDISALTEFNRSNVYQIAEKLLEICHDPACFDDILKGIFDAFSLTLTYEQYVLVGSTIKSYLSWLKDTGKIDAILNDNKLLWKKI